MRSTSPSRPRSCRVIFSSLKSRRSTTAWVAMPAWSVPGIQSVSKPCIRFWRMRMSCSVLFRAWPRCRAPVTLGGGMTIVYGLRSRVRLAVEVASFFPEGDTSGPGRRRDRIAWAVRATCVGGHGRSSATCSSSLHSLYSKLSTRAIQLASMMFSLTPTVPQTSFSSWLSMTTRTPAAVAASELITRTL